MPDDARRARARGAALILALMMASGLVACGRSGAPRLEGHWKGTRADGVSSEAQAAANAFATQTEIDVKGDLITVVTPKDHQAGKYKVVREDKSQIVIVTDKDGPDDAQTFTFVDDKTMKWTVLEGKTITFVKE
jgi:hypothetical protein